MRISDWSSDVCSSDLVDVRRQHPRLEIGRDWIEVIGGRERPTCLATAEEAMVAQMIVDIGNEHVEGDAPIEGMSVRLPLRAMLREGIADLRVSLPSLRSAPRTAAGGLCEIGRATRRERGWREVIHLMVGVSVQKK